MLLRRTFSRQDKRSPREHAGSAGRAARGGTSSRSSPRRARWARAATWARWRTSRWCCSAREKQSFRGERLSGREALRRAGLEPVVLEAKEGLALVNGTQAMEAVGALALLEAEQGPAQSPPSPARMTVEGLKGSHRPFLAAIHRVRGQRGQMEVASRDARSPHIRRPTSKDPHPRSPRAKAHQTGPELHRQWSEAATPYSRCASPRRARVQPPAAAARSALPSRPYVPTRNSGARSATPAARTTRLSLIAGGSRHKPAHNRGRAVVTAGGTSKRRTPILAGRYDCLAIARAAKPHSRRSTNRERPRVGETSSSEPLLARETQPRPLHLAQDPELTNHSDALT